MLHKKQTKIIALSLIFVFIFTICFSNIAFATTTNDGLETV